MSTEAAQPSAWRGALAAADRAAASEDGTALASSLLPLVNQVTTDLAYELVAVIELSRCDVELAALRWSSLRRHGPLQARPAGRLHEPSS